MVEDCFPEICEKLDQLPLNVSDVLSDKAKILVVDDDKISRNSLQGSCAPIISFCWPKAAGKPSR